MTYPEFIPSVETMTVAQVEDILPLLKNRIQPLLLKGAVEHWAIVEAGRQGQLSNYLSQFDSGKPSVVFRMDKKHEGRVFYNENFSGFNFARDQALLVDALKLLESHPLDGSGYYVGSSSIPYYFPGLTEKLDLGVGAIEPLISLWFGNKTRIAAHFDLPDNLACVVAGRRRFTLFPPEQVSNLYVGPLDFTPAGQAISLVDFYHPDPVQFPNYDQALNSALVANMEAGDVLFVPSMWWHQVEGLDKVNMLINFWWRATPAWSGLPQDAISLALLSIGSLPKAQREAWGHIFQHFVVNREQATAHIPPGKRGILTDLNAQSAVQLMAGLMSRLQKFLT